MRLVQRVAVRASRHVTLSLRAAPHSVADTAPRAALVPITCGRQNQATHAFACNPWGGTCMNGLLKVGNDQRTRACVHARTHARTHACVMHVSCMCHACTHARTHVRTRCLGPSLRAAAPSVRHRLRRPAAPCTGDAPLVDRTRCSVRRHGAPRIKMHAQATTSVAPATQGTT